MARASINTVRTYTLPPADLMSIAEEKGLRILVGLDYPDWRIERTPGRQARRRVLEAGRQAAAEAMERCAFDPAVLAIAVGNEIPADLVRLHGAHAVEDILSELIEYVHMVDPAMPATYVNYPGTEYLEVWGQDFVSFNVFLEDREAFRAYLRHLQVVSQDLPLVITELGLGSEKTSEAAQTETLAWQLQRVDEAGCAGAVVFSWTDEWTVNGEAVEGWGFGITDTERNPKPAFKVVRRWARASLRDLRRTWPSVSVVVCARNAEDSIEECLASLEAVDYPRFEVIVCDDGSTDDTAEIAGRSGFRVLELPRVGLAAARNAGVAAAKGEIVAFLDADAICHPDWPYHLVLSLEDDKVVATGGPNLPMPTDGLTEHAVDSSPGRPSHVLIADDRAEHVAGCNMAFRRKALTSIGGFDPVFTSAGDDVDVCWKLHDLGHEIAFSPAAQVRHRRRSTFLGYLRQQRGYGRAERLLYPRHRHRFDRLGQARWSGFVYGPPGVISGLLRPRVYHGSQGMAPYQPILRRRYEALGSHFAAILPLLIVAGLAALVTAVLAPQALYVAYAAAVLLFFYAAGVAVSLDPPRDESRTGRFRFLVGILHLLQPLARLWGRAGYPAIRPPKRPARWTGDRAAWLAELERDLLSRPCRVKSGTVSDSWDLSVSVGPFISCRITAAVAGGWTPLYRYSLRPRLPVLAALVSLPAYFLWGAPSAGLMLGAFIGAFILESVVVSQVVRGSLKSTTRGAAIPTGKVAAKQSLRKRAGAEARPFLRPIALIVLLSLLSAPLWLAAPFPIKVVVDNVLAKQPLPSYLSGLPDWLIGSRFTLLWWSAGALALIGLLIQLLQIAINIVQTRAGEAITLGFRSRLFHHIQQLRVYIRDAKTSADAMARIRHDAPAVQRLILQGVIPIFSAAIALSAAVVAIFLIDGDIGLVALAMVPIFLVLNSVYSRRMRTQETKSRRLETRAMGVVQEVVGALRIAKPVVREHDERERFLRHSSRGVTAQVRKSIAEGVFTTLVGVTAALGTGLILVLGAIDAGAGVITIGQLLLILAYLGQLYGPLEKIGDRLVVAGVAAKSASRAFELLESPSEVPERPRARALERAAGAIEFVDVKFGYQGQSPILDNVSFSIAAGARVGVTSDAEAAKSAVTNLITRFYDPSEGQVLLDGVDLRDYRLGDLRNQIAVVSSDSIATATSIAENIGFGQPFASMQEIVAAAKAAKAHGFILNLNDGYYTRVGDPGVHLSQVERQQIAIARAFLRDAPLLILREPDDTEDEGEGRDALIEATERLLAGRTSFVIAGRPETLDRCQIVLSIDKNGGVAVTKLDRAAKELVAAGQANGKVEARPTAAADGNNGKVVQTGPPKAMPPAQSQGQSSNGNGRRAAPTSGGKEKGRRTGR
jgi:ABC-type multidrug transport system fused ATPase/permease subunit/glycosyltransferase involved in cell wall biosynthesis